MEKVSLLRQAGLFDAKVPRYTSYPPANRFQLDVGARHQRDWLAGLPADEPVSIYVHIPFCRRLCWFCACRTQGTKTLSPVKSYVDDLITEIQTTSSLLPNTPAMARLHLGGGTPTLLTVTLMRRLLGALFEAFPQSDDFEFSVEIDPTEAAPELLEELARWRMTRASIGVQDFAPAVQQAIGRIQSFEQTKTVVDHLRALGVDSLNADLLYGLPFQTSQTLTNTLDHMVSLNPDRIALYGYAHVPHMSKRQVMIPSDALPNPEERLISSELARARLETQGFEALGIDHFARPEDSLARAARAGRMRRNFQGYTDDPCPTLIGFGASAISRFPLGYLQNAVSTAAYRGRVQHQGLAGCKGYELSTDDLLSADLINAIMCAGQINMDQVANLHPDRKDDIRTILDGVERAFPDLLERQGATLSLRPGLGAAARLIAAHLDQTLAEQHIHSVAI